MASTHAPRIWSPIVAALVIYSVVGLVLGVFAAFLVIYSGAFNVAATVKDSAPLQWVLITTREASVQRHARAIEVPRPGGAQQVENGFRIFRDQCAMCHTPPGGQPTMMAEGLNPQAPPLAELVSDMNDAELFWVTKNGIRFTGMPAWASSHKDQDIWGVVAFMRASATMPPADYDALDRRLSGPPDTK
ncbi:c-type cytochrome [Sphingopyxis chilensis]